MTIESADYCMLVSEWAWLRSQVCFSHYYHIHGHFALPVSWMSIECFYGKFSQKSYVWAFEVNLDSLWSQSLDRNGDMVH